MNLITLSRRYCAALVLSATVLLLAGCWQDRIVWSPDGERAAILTKDGLHLCDATGALTPLLAKGVYRAVWFADSKRLVLARSRRLPDYASLVAALGPERSRALAAKAEFVWQQVLASPRGEFNVLIEPHDDLQAIIAYVRQHHGAALRAKMAEDPKSDLQELEQLTIEWHSLVVAQQVDGRLEFGATLSEGLAKFQDVRLAPNQSAVAFVTRLELSAVPDNGFHLFVVPAAAKSAPVLVASNIAAHPDWTADSRALVYLKAANSRAAGPDLQLGALVERGVVDAKGRIQMADTTRELAGLIFQEQNRVRCLRDGRILFDAGEFHLPLAGGGRPAREQIFALEHTKGAAIALRPLISHDQLAQTPNVLASFEVSPDQEEVLLHAGADVHVLTLATGRVRRLALGAYDNLSKKNPPLPVWRRAGEIVYLKKGPDRNTIVLRNASGETELSQTWPHDVLDRLIE